MARVLVVDDSETLLRVTQASLARAGFTVDTARGSAEALLAATATPYDLAVVDLVMPDHGGLQVLAQLAEQLGRALPSVLTCTRPSPITGERLEELGVVDTIRKPFSPDAIVAVVENALQSQRRQSRLAFDEDDEATIPMRPGAVLTEAAKDPSDVELTRALAAALNARGVQGATELASRLMTAISTDDELRSALGTALDAPRPLPILYGDLEAIELPEVLQLIKLQGQSGVLEVIIKGARYEATFREGRIFSVRAMDPRAEQRLGRYFVISGAISAEILQTQLREPTSDAALGQRLVDAGHISEAALFEAVREQAIDLVYEMLRAQTGFFALRRGIEALPRARGLGFSVDAILFEALRRVDEWRVVEREVPSLDTRFCLSDDATLDDLSNDERAVAELARGGTITARAVMAAHKLKTFEACKVLYRLVVLQRLEIEAHTDIHDAPDPTARSEA